MNTKANEVSMFASQLSKVANDFSQRGEELAEHVLKSKKQAEKNLHRWESGMREIVKKHPGKTLLGALVMGFILAKVSRYV
jgi:hypothetical protein